jgi:DNA-binding LytR/AlgR family response regulator
MIRCIAVDDETPALEILEDNISRVPFLQLVKKCKNAYQAIDLLRQEKIDLLFLDIEMPGLSGLRLLQQLADKPMVIFITAYRKYAADGYELDVLDYLVKPVSFERFLKAAHKALEYQELRQQDYLFIQSEYKLTKVFIHDILYIEGLGNYVKIHLACSTRPILSRQSMKAIGDRLPAGKHVRVHKSFIVMINKITSVRNESITIREREIPLSRFYRDEFFKLVHNP